MPYNPVLLVNNPAIDTADAVTTVQRQHRPALNLDRLHELVSRIYACKGLPGTRLAVMLNLLVFIRSSEHLYARLSEIDFGKALCTIPAERKPIFRGERLNDTVVCGLHG